MEYRRHWRRKIWELRSNRLRDRFYGRHKEVIAGSCPRRGVHFKRDALATRNSNNRPTKLNRGSVFLFNHSKKNNHYDQKKEIEFSELEYAILRYEAAFIAQQYTRHKSTTIPYLPPKMSYKRLIYFLVEQRHEWYQQHKKRAPLERALQDFGIDSRQTYYNWYEKWHSDYLKLQKRHHI